MNQSISYSFTLEPSVKEENDFYYFVIKRFEKEPSKLVDANDVVAPPAEDNLFADMSAEELFD